MKAVIRILFGRELAHGKSSLLCRNVQTTSGLRSCDAERPSWASSTRGTDASLGQLHDIVSANP